MKRAVAAVLALTAGLLILTDQFGWQAHIRAWWGSLATVEQRYPGARDAVVFVAGFLAVLTMAALAIRGLGRRQDREDTYVRIYGRPMPPAAPVVLVFLAWLVSLPDLLKRRRREQMNYSSVHAELADWEAAMLDDPLPENTDVIVADPWPKPLSPREHERHPVAEMQPRPVWERLPARYDPMLLPGISYGGMGSMFDNDMRDGVHVYDEDTHARRVIGSMGAREFPRTFYAALAEAWKTRGDVIDAPVSPAAPPVYHPRHKSELVGRGAITGTSAQRARWQNEVTGAFPIVVRELEASR